MEGKKTQIKPVEEWHVYLPDHHEPYISEEAFRQNQHKLLMNNTVKSSTPPVREGNALLQGICLCGLCGRKMSVRYYERGVESRENIPYYVCDAHARSYGDKVCQLVHGAGVDKAISVLVLEKLTPIAISNAIQVEEELRKREADSGNYFVLQLERAQYEVNLARKRYMNVDPSNRLVAHELENIWNHKITALAKAEEELRIYVSAKDKESAGPKTSDLMAIPENITEIWNSDKARAKDKKRILRCLIEDVTLTKASQIIQIGVRFKTGTTTVLECPNPPRAYMTWTTPDEVVEIIRLKSLSHTHAEIAGILQKEGYLSGKGSNISTDIVSYIMREYNIPSFHEHLRAKGFLTASEKAAQLNIATATLNRWRIAGKLGGKYTKTSNKGQYMYEP